MDKHIAHHSFLLLVVGVFACCSCVSSDNSVWGWGPENIRRIYLVCETGNTSETHMTTYVVPDIYPLPDEVYAHPNWLKKVELDFGDGTDWIDVTETYLAYPAVPVIAAPRTYGIPHEYAGPGLYEINGRVTYWDDEIVHTHSPALVQIQ